MSKYIDADLLKAEIERRKGYISVTHFAEELLSFLDSLQQEQTSLPSNLDEAAKKIVIQLHPCMEYSSILGDHLTMGELVELVKAGANWQQEQPSEDLEKEMERFLSNITPAFKDGSYKITRFGFRVVARHFYELGKKSK